MFLFHVFQQLGANAGQVGVVAPLVVDGGQGVQAGQGGIDLVPLAPGEHGGRRLGAHGPQRGRGLDHPAADVGAPLWVGRVVAQGRGQGDRALDVDRKQGGQCFGQAALEFPARAARHRAQDRPGDGLRRQRAGDGVAQQVVQVALFTTQVPRGRGTAGHCRQVGGGQGGRGAAQEEQQRFLLNAVLSLKDIKPLCIASRVSPSCASSSSSLIPPGGKCKPPAVPRAAAPSGAGSRPPVRASTATGWYFKDGSTEPGGPAS